MKLDLRRKEIIELRFERDHVTVTYKNREKEVIKLEEEITELYCSDNQLTSLEDLPLGLTELWCFNNHLRSLENLPSGLTELYCSRNQLTSLENLPSGLTKLNCSDNQLTSLEDLPLGLTELSCCGDQLTSLENLPPRLIELNCSRNQLTSLKNLPSGLTHLDCFGNQLTSLENLPPGLTVFMCHLNPKLSYIEPIVKKYLYLEVPDHLKFFKDDYENFHQRYMGFLETSAKTITLLAFSGITFYDVLACLKNFFLQNFYVKP